MQKRHGGLPRWNTHNDWKNINLNTRGEVLYMLLGSSTFENFRKLTRLKFLRSGSETFITCSPRPTVNSYLEVSNYLIISSK